MNNEAKPVPEKKSLRTKLFRWIKIIVIAYCSIGIVLYYLQENFLFHPVSLPRSYHYQFEGAFAEKEIAFNEKDTLNMVQFFPKDSIRKGLVLYFHGNRENIGRYAKFTEVFLRHGYEVWMEDYPGYGKSTGERSEKKLYEQAMVVYRLAATQYRGDSIILYGKSFGTGIAAYLASQTKSRQLVLETPYYSIPALFGCYAPIYPTQRMSVYKLPSNEYLRQVPYPVTIFHGTGDWVIPYRCAEKLKQVIKSTDAFVTIKNGTHHNLFDFDVYQHTMDSLLSH